MTIYYGGYLVNHLNSLIVNHFEVSERFFMNRPFLKNISNSFIRDNLELYNLNNNDKLDLQSENYNFLSRFMDDLKDSDFGMYESVCRFDRVDSYKFSYYLLDGFYKEFLPDVYDSIFESDSEYIEELFTASTLALSMISIMLFSYYSNLGSRIASKLQEKIADIGASLSKILSRFGSSGKTMQYVLYQRSESCSKQCGVDTKKLPPLTSFIYKFGVFGKGGVDIQNRIQCLTDCYITESINTILALVDSYYKCKVNTGEIPTTIVDYNLIHMLPLGSKCDDIIETLHKFYDVFNESLTVLEKEQGINKYQVIKNVNIRLNDLTKKNVLDVIRTNNFKSNR